METSQLPQLSNITHVRVVEWNGDFALDAEVNEAIQLGWKLIFVQSGESHPGFVLGWSCGGEPPKTAREKRLEKDYKNSV
ncbi:MAG: hypothetical protein WA117_25135 [Verrucomicrobiia bacterium]